MINGPCPPGKPVVATVNDAREAALAVIGETTATKANASTSPKKTTRFMSPASRKHQHYQKHGKHRARHPLELRCPDGPRSTGCRRPER